jgi:ACS family tartrate transporter-like MFS transporter
MPPVDFTTQARGHDELEAVVIRLLTWRLVPFLFLLYIVAYLDRINLGFAALQMQQQLGFTDSMYGLGAGIFFAGYFLFQVPSNLVLVKVGARRWIAILMVTWGIISASMCLFSGPRSFYVLRFLLGAAEAGFFPGVILYLKSWFPARVRARTVARFMTAAPLSGVVGGPLSGALLGLHEKGGLAGWQWMFLLEGIPAILLGALAWMFLVDSPSLASWMGPEQKQWLQNTFDRERAETANVAGAGAIRFWPILILALVYFGLNSVSYGISLWLPNLIKSLAGMSNLAIGMLSAIPYIAAAVAMVMVGLHSDRSGERRWHTAAPALAGASALAMAAHSSSVGSTIALISVAVLGVFSMLGPFWAMPSALLSGTAAAVGIALINSVGNLGGFFGPYMIGVVRNSTGSFKGGLLVVSGALAVSGGLALTLKFARENGCQRYGEPRGIQVISALWQRVKLLNFVY